MQWYYSKNATQLGPVSLDELRAKLASGEVSGTDMVWREGMPDWRPVSTMPELVMNSPETPPVPVTGGVVNSPYSPPSAAPVPPSGFPMVMAPPTSGLAIASLICGIMGLVTCVFLPGIPAVICGHMALKRMADPSIRMGGRGMAIAGLITGYLSIMVIAGSLVVIMIQVAIGSFH